MNADELAESVMVMSRQLAGVLRAGTVTVADARGIESLIRQAEGWLLSARTFLDPEATFERDDVTR